MKIDWRARGEETVPPPSVEPKKWGGIEHGELFMKRRTTGLRRNRIVRRASLWQGETDQRREPPIPLWVQLLLSSASDPRGSRYEIGLDQRRAEESCSAMHTRRAQPTLRQTLHESGSKVSLPCLPVCFPRPLPGLLCSLSLSGTRREKPSQRHILSVFQGFGKFNRWVGACLSVPNTGLAARGE